MNINLRRTRPQFENQRPSQLPPLYFTKEPMPYLQYRSCRSSTPLTSRTLSIPPEIRQFCQRQHLQYSPSSFDCADQFFWVSIENNLFLWRYKHIDLWGTAVPNPQMMLVVTFNQKIRSAQLGEISGFQFGSIGKLNVLAIALVNKIVFFSYDSNKQAFQNMKLQVSTNKELVSQMVFAYGNLYYCGSHATLKTVFNKPRIFRKETKFSMNSSSLMSDTLLNSLLFWKVEQISSSLLVLGQRAYFIVQKQYPRSWLAMKILYSGHQQLERTLKIFDIASNTLLRQIDEHLLMEKIRIHCGRSKQLMEGIHVIGLFSTNNKLGVTLSCGAFAYLNFQGLLVEEVHFIPLVQSKGVVAQGINREVDIIQTVSSLGFENVSIFNKCGVAYADKDSLDICNLPPNLSIIKIRELKSIDSERAGTIFQKPRQWMCLSPQYVVQLKRLRLQDITLVYLQIVSQERILRKNIIIQQPFLHLCALFGNVEVCVSLMQIICSDSLDVQVEEAIYQNTRTQIFRLERPQTRVFSRVTNFRLYSQYELRRIALNEDIIDRAGQILSYIQSRDLNSELDVLWKSVLRYFNQIYSLIKDLTPSECLQKYRLVEFAKYKLECFKRLLHIKSLELSPRLLNKTDDNILSFIGLQGGNIPPIEPSLREKYDSNTPILIARAKQLVDKIYCLLETCLAFKLEDIIQDSEPTIHEILTEEKARDIVRLRIFKEVDSSNLLLEKLPKSFPQLLNQSDQIFNQFILNANTHPHQQFSNESLVPALKTPRIPLVKDYFYKRNELYQYIAILLQRMKYLQVEKHKLQHNQSKDFPFLGHELAQKQAKLEELESNWIVVVTGYQDALRDYIKEVEKSKSQNRLELLVHYVRSLQIEPIIEFTRDILEQQALPHLVRGLKQREERVELKPQTLYSFK